MEGRVGTFSKISKHREPNHTDQTPTRFSYKRIPEHWEEEEKYLHVIPDSDIQSYLPEWTKKALTKTPVAWEDKNLHEINFPGTSRLVTWVQGFGTGRSCWKEQMVMSRALGLAWLERTLIEQSPWSSSLGTVLHPDQAPQPREPRSTAVPCGSERQRYGGLLCLALVETVRSLLSEWARVLASWGGGVRIELGDP